MIPGLWNMPKKADGGAKPKPDDAEQSRRFEETARELQIDDSGEAFNRAVKIVAPPKRERRPQPKRAA